MLSLLSPVSSKKNRQIKLEHLERLADIIQIVKQPRDAHVLQLTAIGGDIVMVLEVVVDQQKCDHAFCLYRPGQLIAAKAVYLASLFEGGSDASASWHLYRLPVPVTK